MHRTFCVICWCHCVKVNSVMSPFVQYVNCFCVSCAHPIEYEHTKYFLSWLCMTSFILDRNEAFETIYVWMGRCKACTWSNVGVQRPFDYFWLNRWYSKIEGSYALLPYSHRFMNILILPRLHEIGDIIWTLDFSITVHIFIKFLSTDIFPVEGCNSI